MWFKLSGLVAKMRFGPGRSRENKKRPEQAAGKDGKENWPENFSEQDYLLYKSHVRNASGPILSYLPLDASKEVRDWTLKQTLVTLFEDKRLHANKFELEAPDVSDIGSFAEFAYYLASEAALPIGAEERCSVYKAAFESLLSEWLHSWNADGKEGAPD